MASVQEAIRRLTIQVTDKGVSETTDKLRGLTKAEGDLTVAHRERVRSIESVESAYNKIQRRYDAVYRQQQQLEKVERDLSAARSAGLIGLDRHNQLMAMAAQQINNTANVFESRSFFKTLAREASLVGGPLGGMIQQFGTLSVGSSKLSLGLVGGTIAFAGLAAGTYKAISAFAEFEAHEAKVAALLNLTGGAQSLGGLEALTRDLSKSGTQSVADIRATEVELLKLRAVAGSTFGDVLALSRDIAATGFAPMSGAATALGKALKDPADASKELDSIGLKLSISQQRLAKDLYNSGQAAAAQRVILKAVSDQVAGSDAKAADTLSASWGRATNALTLQFEAIGKEIAQLFHLKGALDAVAAAADNARKSREAEKQAFEGALEQAMAGRLPGDKGDRQSFSPAAEVSRRFPSTLVDDNAALLAAKQRLDKVTDALTDQARVAGMTAVAHKIFVAQVQAGVLTQNELERGLLGSSDAAKKLAAAVAGIEIAQFMAQLKASSITQNASLESQAATLGMTAGAAAEYSKRSEEIAKAQAAGLPVTDALRAKIEAIATAYGAATQKAENAKIAFQVSFGEKTAFLGSQDVQIAQQLAAKYGGNVPAALASTEAASIRATAAIRQIGDAGSTAFTGLVGDIASGLAGMEALIARASALGKSLTDIGSKSVFDTLRSGLSGNGFNFDPVSIGAGVAGIGIQLVSGWLKSQDAAEKELQKNQEAWAALSKAICDFVEAASEQPAPSAKADNVPRVAAASPANENKRRLKDRAA